MSTANEYNFVTTWYIDAPIEKVWNVLIDFSHWKTWWKALKKLTKVKTTNHEIYKLTVGYFIYFLTLQVIIDKRTKPHSLLFHSSGDLDGKGAFLLTSKEGITTITFKWHVNVTKPWVKYSSTFARPFFQYSHDLVMHWFVQGMKDYLDN